MNRDEFGHSLDDAYKHLYDMVYLRTHPLLDALASDTTGTLGERSWNLHHVLLDAIDELEPTPPMSVQSREWRRHQLMVLRYRRGLEAQDVSEQLGIGLRHFYREHRTAMEILSESLWYRYSQEQAEPPNPAQAEDRVAEDNGPDMGGLRLEVARLAQANRYAQLNAVIEGVRASLSSELARKKLSLVVSLPDLPPISVNRTLLRQTVFQSIGSLVELTEDTSIHVAAGEVGSGVVMTFSAHRPAAVNSDDRTANRLVALSEIAEVGGMQASLLPCDKSTIGYRLDLPLAERTILAIDDNEDTLKLLCRFLVSHDFPVVTASTADRGFELACSLRPQAILLDLMMPGRDGWDLMQSLTSHPDTESIPIVVCTVLKQRDLVLSLGASAFLPKPVSEQELIRTLEQLRGL